MRRHFSAARFLTSCLRRHQQRFQLDLRGIWGGLSLWDHALSNQGEPAGIDVVGLGSGSTSPCKITGLFWVDADHGELVVVQRVEHVTLKPAACFKQHQGGVFAKPHHFMEPRLVVAQQGDLVAATAGQVKGVFANIGSYQRLTQGTVLWVGWEPSDGPRLSTCGGVVPPNCSGLLSKGTQAWRTNATRRSFPTQRHTIYQACSHPDSSAVCTYKRHGCWW